jgi:hypothetical protein
MRSLKFFSIYLILPAALGSLVYSASNKKEYLRQKVFLGNGTRRVREADNLAPPVSRLSRQCGIFNISQPYRTPHHVTLIALLCLFVAVHTSQETPLSVSMVCYRDR